MAKKKTEKPILLVVGLGNPGEEYELTRHNTGRMLVEALARGAGVTEWEYDKKIVGHIATARIGKTKATLLLPDTFMNKSGNAVVVCARRLKAKPEQVLVVYDDVDLPLSTLRISFDRGSGGHHGLESVAKTLKTNAFPRLRVGIAATTPSGKLKKPHGDEFVTKFLLGKFKQDELTTLKKVSKRVNEAIETALASGREVAMNQFNH